MLASFEKSLRATLWVVLCLAVAVTCGYAEAGGGSATVSGTVLDPSGAVVPNASVEIHNPVSGFSRSTKTNGTGGFSFPNVPLNPYHLNVSESGFAPYSQDIDVRSSVPLNLKVTLQLQESKQTVTVEGETGDLLENDPTFHTDVDRKLFDRLPLESSSSEVSSLVTLSSPGVTADSNGLFHGLGDHAENSFSVDGQPITDQQSKAFSNQIPLDSVQSMQVIAGAPPAEYGDKTSLVINVTTRSGLGVTEPHGQVTASYGTFGSSNAGFNLAYGGDKWGNFISANGLNTGRFLDPPEFAVMHAKGNEENVFDRVDYQLSTADSLHLNLGFTRSWFQTPNSYDNLNIGVTDPSGNLVGPTDQRSQIRTFNIAPSWTRLINNSTSLTTTAYVRKDDYNYYPSGNPFADFGPIQSETVRQHRTLTNAGLTSYVSYTKGVHNVKAGAMYEQTFLNENDGLGIVNPTLNSPCVDSAGTPVVGFTNPSQCATAGLQPNSGFTPLLGCFDLTRKSPSAADGCAGASSGLFNFRGHTDVKELALYVQDTISKGNWTANLGIRGDLYNGISIARQAEPRLGVSYNIKKTNTVLRASYARLLETPFNENLVLSSTGCQSPVIASLVPCVPSALNPGWRNEFHAGLQQAFGQHLVVEGEYIWKYTHNGYDFSILGNTPIFFPIEWHNSKITGFAGRVSVPNYHGFTALVVMSSVAARFFPPQIGGLGVTVGQSGTPFRIDHDEVFNQTTHLQYQPWKRGPWFAFNWRYDSGLVAGSVPCFGTNAFNNCPQSTLLNGQPAIDLSGFTADQEFQAGMFCGAARATPFAALPSPCLASQFGSNLVSVPAPGTQNPDHNPARIAPRSLFDVSVGHDNIFNGDKYKWSLGFTVINVTNNYALYNFLSTFSGTHYVTPRTLTVQIGFHF
jgi:hypothetical protein